MTIGFAFLCNSILLGIGLAMDAFSVSLANGLNEPQMKKGRMCAMAGVFAFFQALMPMAGWVCVHTIVNMFHSFERCIPWIALILLSFIGWVWEVGVMFVQTGKFFNQGFLTLPICPIYGTTLLIVYFLLGTPQNPKGILKGVHKKMAAQFLYFSFAFLIPTVCELCVGIAFEKTLHVSLWGYSNLPLCVFHYACVPVSFVWAILIFLFMRYAFTPLKRVIEKLPSGLTECVSFSLLFIFLVDFSLNFAILLFK